MLRTFDYAARVVERSLSTSDEADAELIDTRAEEWAERNKNHFLVAYAGGELSHEQQVLLSAYVADKAVYETVYETRNRPSWVDDPAPGRGEDRSRMTPRQGQTSRPSSPSPPTSSSCSSRGEHGSPHSILGPHPHDGGVTDPRPQAAGRAGRRPARRRHRRTSWPTSTRASGSACCRAPTCPTTGSR